MTNYTTTTQPATVAGFDRFITAQHKGCTGIKTGSVARSPGHTHLLDSTTQRTGCGRLMKGYAEKIRPLHDLTPEAWADRLVTCPTCRKHI